MRDMREVLIVGGGPAGLSAALLLGRCRRTVTLIDSGTYRNADADVVHGYLARDGLPPGELRAIGRAEIGRFTSVELRDGEVSAARRDGDLWVLTLADGEELRGRALLLATGVVDVLPPVPGARELHGRRVLPCPYCEGWEHRDRALAAFSHPDDRGATFALILSQWSRDLVLLTGAPARFGDERRAQLDRAGIRVDSRPIARFGDGGDALEVHFRDGTVMRRDALFYHLGALPRSPLAEALCAVDERGSPEVDRLERTRVPGLWVAGDATRDALLAIVAAGEGAAAAVSINAWLSAQAWSR